MARIKIRRGLETNRLSITPLEGELIYIIDTKKAYLGDGITPGGIMLNQSANEILSKISNIDGTTSGLDGDLIHGLEGSQILRSDIDSTFDNELMLDDSILSNINNINVNTNNSTDVFLYDTTKDSDGGAWRYKNNKTSWYNETLNTTTRGATKEFPAMALIIAESNVLTIYDATDSNCPMWMVFNTHWGSMLRSGLISSICGINGIICVGHETGSAFHIVNLLKETSQWLTGSPNYGGYYSRGNIINRNYSGSSGYIENVSGSNLPTIINSSISDVTITVLPNAPIDTETNLPIPTIAVSANSGVSIIHNDESIVDLSYVISGNGESGHVEFYKEGIRWTSNNSNGYVYVQVLNVLPYSNVSTAPDHFYSYANQIGIGHDIDLMFSINGEAITLGLEHNAIATHNGLTLLENDNTGDAQNDSMTNYITKDFQTGWMYGDIKGAFLSSTDSTNLVSPELITNGTFDTNTTGWSGSTVTVNPPTLSIDTNRLKATAALNNIVIVQSLSGLKIGKRYKVRFDAEIHINHTSLNIGLWLDDLSNQAGSVIATDSTNESFSLSFTASSTNHDILLGQVSASINTSEYILFDNISLKIIDDDRSIHQKDLDVFGTITRSAVEVGAELMGYSGFSSSNYLEQPYNSDLNFGTNDFYIMGWMKSSTTQVQYMYDKVATAPSLQYVLLITTASGLLRFTMYSGGIQFNLIGTKPVTDDKFHFVVGTRKDGVLNIYVDGELDGQLTGSTLNAEDSVSVKFGNSRSGGAPLIGQMALWRTGSGSPSGDQIKEIYESEGLLFKKNASCTLSSTTNSTVNALSYDKDTQELHVAGTDNLDTFKGLVRTKSETGAYTSLSSSNGVVVKGN